MNSAGVLAFRQSSRPAWVGYAMAFVVGALFVTSIFPLGVATGLNVPDSMLTGDVAQHVVGQRYFIGDIWRWPLLTTRLLEGPDGVNIGLTDSIPFAALIAKVFRSFLPPGFTAIFPWLAVAYLGQPLAAVFALQSAGERGLTPTFAVSVLAISTPTLLYRFGHIALSSHFLILIALGLYYRIVLERRAMPAATTALLVVSLLVHPYLLMMVAAVLVAGPLSLLVQRQAVWRTASVALCGGILLTAGLFFVLGYGGRDYPPGGFGQASMNLLSPFYPGYSSVLQPLVSGLSGPIDATGFQYEGYQYLGAGLFLLAGVALLIFCRRDIPGSVHRHAGLWLICLCLCLLALSNVVYFGHHRILKISPIPAFMHEFRSSGRFFWPVTYALLIGSVARVASALPCSVAVPLLLSAAVLQYFDATQLRQSVAGFVNSPASVSEDGVRLRTLLAEHSQLTIWPTAACGANTNSPEFMRVLVAASDTLIPVNSMYVARENPTPRCDAMDVVGRPLGPGELRVFMPLAARAAASVVPGGSTACRALGTVAVCSVGAAALDGLPTMPLPISAVGRTMMASSLEALPYLGVGWSRPEPSGIWTLGRDATLIVHLDHQPSGPVTLTVWGHSFTRHPSNTQEIAVSVGTRKTADWKVTNDGDNPYRAVFPAGFLTSDTSLVRFTISDPTRPTDMGVNDSRELGFFMTAFRIDTSTTVPSLQVLP